MAELVVGSQIYSVFAGLTQLIAELYPSLSCFSKFRITRSSQNPVKMVLGEEYLELLSAERMDSL